MIEMEIIPSYAAGVTVRQYVFALIEKKHLKSS